MTALVVYDSQFGNTERVARAIADALGTRGPARAVRVTAAGPTDVATADVIVVGSPTQGWRPTQAMQAFVASSSASRARTAVFACFDTRFRQARWLTGSAAVAMANRVRARGGKLLAAPESFFVQHTQGPLFDGELERATAWARALLAALPAEYRAASD